MASDIKFRDLGLVDYKTCWDMQEALLKKATDTKRENRLNETARPIDNHLFFVEHPHVYTLGKSGSIDHLLVDEQGLERLGASYYKINRGGDITYHGPGQIVGYPIIDLEQFKPDIGWYMRSLEEAIIMTLGSYGIASGRIDGLTGVWLGEGSGSASAGPARKIAALGVKCSRWVTMHGFAFNVNTDLSMFGHIVPCGIDDKAVTSMAIELGHAVDMDEVKDRLKSAVAVVLNASFI